MAPRIDKSGCRAAAAAAYRASGGGGSLGGRCHGDGNYTVHQGGFVRIALSLDAPGNQLIFFPLFLHLHMDVQKYTYTYKCIYTLFYVPHVIFPFF